MCRRCYTTISNDIFVIANSVIYISDDLFINGLKLFVTTIVTINDENVVADGIIIATTLNF